MIARFFINFSLLFSVDALSSLEMFIIEENSEYLGVSKTKLMEHAGMAIARFIRSRFKPGSVILFVCGPGNNGGDGLVAARILAGEYDVHVIHLGGAEKIRTEEARSAWKVVTNLLTTLKLHIVKDSSEISRYEDIFRNADVVVDAILGTGVRGEVRGVARKAIEYINSLAKRKVSIDIPSGLDPDTGEVKGVAVKADYTITLHAPKKGLLKNPEYVGELLVEPIGIPYESTIICGPGDVKVAYRFRDEWSRKGDNGLILVIGGSKLYSGAPALAALAALKAGVDLVVVAAPKPAADVIKTYSPDLIVRPLPGEYLTTTMVDDILELSKRFDAVLIGPGLGREPDTIRAIRTIVEKLSAKSKLVIDADALKALKDVKLRGGVVTPHAGELRIMTGLEVSTDINDRVEKTVRASKRIGAVVLLKGRYDVISDGSRYKINKTGNPGMTVGGTGDVLAGLVAAFLAWCKDPFRAACAAAFINGFAGDILKERIGFHITATGLIDCIPEAFSRILR